MELIGNKKITERESLTGKVNKVNIQERKWVNHL